MILRKSRRITSSDLRTTLRSQKQKKKIPRKKKQVRLPKILNEKYSTSTTHERGGGGGGWSSNRYEKTAPKHPKNPVRDYYRGTRDKSYLDSTFFCFQIFGADLQGNGKFMFFNQLFDHLTGILLMQLKKESSTSNSGRRS